MHRSQPGSDHRETIAQIPLRSGSIPSWVHDFPYTQNYMILPETPVYFDLKVGLSAAVLRVCSNRGSLIMLVAPWMGHQLRGRCSMAPHAGSVAMQALATGKLGDYVIINWKPEEDSLLHVVPLDGKGPVRSFKAPRYFTFHYMNAYESGGSASMAGDGAPCLCVVWECICPAMTQVQMPVWSCVQRTASRSISTFHATMIPTT